MNQPQDKTTISVSGNGQEVLTVLGPAGRRYFESELGAFLAAASLAIALGLDPADFDSPSAGTKWNRGSGAIGDWEKLAKLYLSTEEPIKMLEKYGEAGLRHLRDRLELGLSVTELFSKA